MILKINGKETNYEIFKDGTIKNLKTDNFLKGNVNNTGYRMVTLTVNGNKKGYALHRLVAKTFLENPLNLPVVNHIDGNKLNNCVDNLEWATYSKNTIHAYENNLTSKATGKRNKVKKGIVEDDIVWKNYKDSNYLVSKDGSVYNKKTKTLLKQTVNSAGYIRYNLRIDNKTVSKQAHILVYDTWIGLDKDTSKVINHIDGNKTNNSLSNLELVSKQENSLHFLYTLGKNIKPIIRMSDPEVLYPSLTMAAKQNNVTPGAICYALKHNSKCKGFLWKYK